jgi:hypothetical protein
LSNRHVSQLGEPSTGRRKWGANKPRPCDLDSALRDGVKRRYEGGCGNWSGRGLTYTLI